MPGTRTHKIQRDIMARKSRAFLASLSILVGVFGVVLLVGVGDLLIRQLREDTPSDQIAMLKQYLVLPRGQLSLEENRAILEGAAENIPGVTQIEGQAIYPAAWRKTGSNDSYTGGFVLAYTQPFDRVRLEPANRVLKGRYPEAGNHEIAVEQRFADQYDIKLGDQLTFQLLAAGQESDAWTVVGFVLHSFITFTPSSEEDVVPEKSIFANYTDAQQIVGFSGLSSIYVRYDDYATAEAGADAFAAYISSRTDYVAAFQMLDDPDNSYLLEIVRQVVTSLNILAGVAMVVSGFLVVNIISAIVVEQKRQIGVLKSLGATRLDVFRMYAGIALVYGVIGTVLGILLAIPFTSMIAEAIAFSAKTYIAGFKVSPLGIAAGLMMGLLVPVLAALVPVLNGTRVSIREAITDLGISSKGGSGWQVRLINTLPVPISIRQAFCNVVQKKGRLLLTAVTLMLAVAAFMGVLAATSTISDQLDHMFDTRNFDLIVSPQAAQDQAAFTTLLQSMGGVKAVAPGYSASVDVQGYEETDAVGVDTAHDLFKFDLTKGHGWETDTVDGVILTTALADELRKTVGDKIVLEINGQPYARTIIGTHNYPFEVLYMPWTELAALSGYVDETGNPLPSSYYVQMNVSNPTVGQVDDQIERMQQQLAEQGIAASFINQPRDNKQMAQMIDVFGLAFSITSAVMAIVGAIGLLATLSMAIYERQKEIGVMRSVGAGSGVIVAQFLTEGITVGILAWIVALPVSFLLGNGLLHTLPFSGMVYRYPSVVPLAGLGGMLIVAAVASLWPSLSAARRRVSDILRYQ